MREENSHLDEEISTETIDKKEISEKKKVKLEKKKENQRIVDDLWAQAGWHRPLAGFWFNYVLVLVIVVPAILSGILLNMVLPFPEALGFANIVTGVVLPFYHFADFGVKNAVERFVSQYAETEPKRAMKYIAFYIWFQMFTGLIQITLIAIIAITIIPLTNMGYAVWFFLVYSMIQWPSTAGIFMVVLGGFQKFDKQNVLWVIQNAVIQIMTTLGFIILGRWLGSLNPTVGELMGAVMGFIWGSYFDDLMAMVIGAYFFKKVLKPFGFKLKEVMFISFDREIIKEVVIYGGKVVPSGLVFYAVSALINIMLVTWLFNYSTLLGLYQIAALFVDAFSLSFSNGPPISEAYNNDKKELALFYIRSQFQWWGIIAIGVFLGPVLFLIPSIIGYLAAEYAEAAPMIYPLFLAGFILFPTNFSGVICEACNFPEYSTYMNFIEQGTRFLTHLIALAPWGVASWFGYQYVLIFWLFANAPAYAFKGVYGWYVVNKKLFPRMKLKIPLYQTIIAPFIAMLPFLPLYSILIQIFVNIYYWANIVGYMLAGIYLLGCLFIFPIFIFMPLYGFLGAWDEKSLDDFRKGALMAGPSKLLVSALYKAAKFGYEHSPFKGRFVIEYEQAEKEAVEITEIRRKLEKKNN